MDSLSPLWYLVSGISMETARRGKPEGFYVFRDTWNEILGEVRDGYAHDFHYTEEPPTFGGVAIILIDDVEEAKGALHV